MAQQTKAAATSGSGEFRALLEESTRTVQPGQVVRGTVLEVTSEYVTVDIGYKSEGRIPIREFTDPQGNVTVREGDEVEVYFESTGSDDTEVILSRTKAEQRRVWQRIGDAYESGGTVEGVIVGKVKGGLKVDLGVSAFLPGSHVDIRPGRNLEKYVGERGRFAVLKFNRNRGNVVVSRRLVLEREREQMKEETLKVLEEGIVLEGTVKNITEYGAFVDLGGIDGLLHVTDMSWGRVNKPTDVVQVGDKVKVVVLKYDPERGRVSLGMKQIVPDPWTTVAERYPVGSRVRGKVVSLTDYGAFVEVEPGVEGLVHVSEMSWTRRVTHPSSILQQGQEVDVVVIDVDPANRRMSLGLKQAEPNPWELVRINHPVGSRVRGKVKSITDFGIFVGVEEGIDGLVHISDFHWTKKVRHPSEMFQKGDEVEAVVLSIDTQQQRLSLGIKQLTEDPWKTLPQRCPPGTRVKGKVTSVADFGVFVEIEDGVEGLIHVSQLSTERVEKPQTMFAPGQEVEAEVTAIDVQDRKISLSIRALRQSEERREMEAYLRQGGQGGGFSLQDVLKDQLRLGSAEREEGGGEAGSSDSKTDEPGESA